MNLFFLRRLVRSIWFRPAAYAVISVLAIGLTPLFSRVIPEEWSGWVKVEAVEQTLQILASSLLAVAIFALATMFSAFQAAAQAATPRARPLMTQDRTAQTAVSTFIGTFLFSLLALIGLASGFYADTDMPVVFTVTLTLVGVVVYALIRWIQRLSGFGGVEEAISAIEEATREAVCANVRYPVLGGKAAKSPPGKSSPVEARRVGYVQSVDHRRLADLIEKHGITVHINARPGRFVGPGRPVAFVSKTDDDVITAIGEAFVVAQGRTFQEDPRFGLIALTEIAERALSPAVNDPGTAISVLAAQARIFTFWSERRDTCEAEPPVEGLTCVPLDLDAAFRDAFLPIARDGATQVEVAIRLQKSLTMIEICDPDQYGKPVAAVRKHALGYAEAALKFDWEKKALKEAEDLSNT